MATAGHMRGKPRVRLPHVQLPRDRLPFVPRNEAGVAVLFGMFAGDLGVRITGAQYAFPDCTIDVAGRNVGVELEYRSRSFATHVRNGQWPSRRCEMVLCWQHDWPSMPERLKVLELRKVFGLGWSAWIVPMHAEYADSLPRGREIGDYWSVPSKSGPDDLLLIYRPGREQEVRELFRLRSPVERVKAGWRSGLDWMGSIQRVATLEEPLTLKDLTGAGVSRHALQGRPEVTDRWTRLRKRILTKNPGLEEPLARFGPDRT